MTIVATYIQTRFGLTWRCAIRIKNINCSTTVKEFNQEYVRGPQAHCHPPGTCPLLSTSKVSALVKKRAVEDVFRSATDIAEEVLREEVDINVPLSSLPAPENLARQGNHKRRTLQPPEPLDLAFEICYGNIPNNFLQHDIVIGFRCHLVFSTPEQLSLLKKAKHWYCDATFKIARHPFTQLFSVHAHVKNDDNIKQVPLLYAMMSGKRCCDYEEVFSKTIELLGEELGVGNNHRL